MRYFSLKKVFVIKSSTPSWKYKSLATHSCLLHSDPFLCVGEPERFAGIKNRRARSHMITSDITHMRNCITGIVEYVIVTIYRASRA